MYSRGEENLVKVIEVNIYSYYLDVSVNISWAVLCK